jgi:hypothetical protein
MTSVNEVGINGPFINAKLLRCYYRFEDSANATTFNASLQNTVWIDANNSANPLTTGNYFGSGSPIIPPSYYLGGKSTTINSYNNNTLIINAAVPSLPITTSSIYLYFRLGLPMDVAAQFEYVTATISS